MKKVYSKQAIPMIPRLISLIDRNEISPTYGCCDRSYWNYKLTDFSNVRFQECALTLALVYSNKYPNNTFYRNETIKQWALSAMEFWSKIQHKNGSFDELYPNENSFGATAFTSYTIAESLRILSEDMDESLKERIIKALGKTAVWLNNNKDQYAVNQNCGAITMFHILHQVTEDENLLSFIDNKIDYILERQNEEGWLPEYGGPDFGYLSLAVDYLGKYYKETQDARALDIARKAIKFIRYFVHPNGTIGGEYGSRATTYLIPHGFEIFSKQIYEAREIALRILTGLKKSELVSPSTIDDRYFAYNIYTYLQAYDDFFPKRASLRDATKTRFRRYFPNSRLLSIKTPKYYTVVGFNKGGVFKLYTKNYIYSDSGFVGELRNGKKVTTQWLDKEYETDGYKVSGKFHIIKYQTMNPIKMIASRCFLTLPGDWMGPFTKESLRQTLIMESKKTNIKFERSFLFGDKIRVKDKIIGNGFKTLKITANFSPIHVASSKYFEKQEIELKREGYDVELADLIDNKKKLNIERTFGKGIKVKVS